MKNITPRCFVAAVLPAAFLIGATGSARGSELVPQTALDGPNCIPKFAVELPVFGPAGSIPRVDAVSHHNLTVTMKEIDQEVLPKGHSPNTCPEKVTFKKTRVWAYETSDTKTGKILGPANWPAVTIEARRGIPTRVTYVNQLPSFNFADPDGPGLVQGLLSVDQTLHWANPMGAVCGMPVNCSDPTSPTKQAALGFALCTTRSSNRLDAGIRSTVDQWITDLLPKVSGGASNISRLLLQPANASATNPCCQPFTGPQPATVHLHGGELPAAFDGGPDTWFTPNNLKGPEYSTLDSPGPGGAIYLYDNSQEPGTLFFHDHALGATRNNVYAGLAGFYFLRDPSAEPRKLPSGPYEIEMAIQDRSFDTNSQLYFTGSGGPGSDNPPATPDFHPFWIPQFQGDVAIVNGAPSPYLEVEPRRYRFRLVNGANSRRFDLSFGKAPVYQIGADDNYFDESVYVNGTACAGKQEGQPCSDVSLLPGERADIIVDFTNLAGQTITMTNSSTSIIVNLPDIMQFRVVLPLKGRDTSCDPADPNPVNGFCARPTPLVQLTDGHGHLAPGVKIDKVRQLIAGELNTASSPPLEIEEFVENTYWDGLESPSIASDFAKTKGVSELPRVGSTELWEIINFETGFGWHPMHTHLVQFQVLNRQNIDATGYQAAWNAAFPTSCDHKEGFCPGYGPPLPYNTSNADGAVGGNPAIGDKSTPGYLSGDPMLPDPGETGWKDTVKSFPSTVTRLVVRFAPTSTPVNQVSAGVNRFPFDSTKGTYVWHCHIIDHEDNEMMRPYRVTN